MPNARGKTSSRIRASLLGHSAIKKPPPKQGPWIVLPGDESASLRDRPVFPEWVLYDFQPLGIRLPGCVNDSKVWSSCYPVKDKWTADDELPPLLELISCSINNSKQIAAIKYPSSTAKRMY